VLGEGLPVVDVVVTTTGQLGSSVHVSLIRGWYRGSHAELGKFRASRQTTFRVRNPLPQVVEHCVNQ